MCKVGDVIKRIGRNFPVIGDYFCAESGERLAFWGVLLGLIVGFSLAARQEKSSANLNALTKNAEINMLLMQELNVCRNEIQESVGVESSVSLRQGIANNIKNCRGRIGVSMAGLKALRDKFGFDGAADDYKEILKLDKNLSETLQIIKNSGANEIEIPKNTIDHIFELISSNDPNAATIDKLENKLKQDSKVEEK